MCTNNYSNISRFDNVIAKIKWCSFFATQCIYLVFSLIQSSAVKRTETEITYVTNYNLNLQHLRCITQFTYEYYCH